MAFKYHGILAKARKHDPVPGPLASDDARTAWIERYKSEFLKRWRALFDAHGVAWGNESELLWRLAEAHVPGLNMHARSGPKATWDATTKVELRIAVNECVADRQRQGKSASVTQACAILAKRDPWKGKLRLGKKPSEALRGHYNTADPRMVDRVVDARRLALVKALGDYLKVPR
jgi:hypothetical protein